MADVAGQIQQARAAGYTDAQIADHLAGDPAIGPKITTARQHGYSDADILGHLGGATPPAQAAPAAPATHTLAGDIGDAFNSGIAAAEHGAGVSPNGEIPQPELNPLKWAGRVTEGGQGLLGLLAAGLSPVTGTIKHVGGRPLAEGIVNGLEAMGLHTYDPHADITTAKPLTHDQAVEQWVGNLATSLAGLGGEATPAKAARAAVPPPPPAPPSALATNVAKFDAAGVRPTLAATGGPQAAAAAKFAAEDPLVGAKPQANIRASIADTAAAADRTAAGYGTPSSTQAAGQVIQRGVTRFARDADAPDSFAAKANQIYDRVFNGIPNGPVQLDATQQVVGDILGRVQAPNVASLTRSPIVQRLADAVAADAKTGAINFQDLRALRTWVREAKSNPELRGNIGSADLSRIEGALTDDIYANTTRLTNNPSWTRRLQQADRFYSTGMDRIDGSLAASFNAGSPEAAYDGLVAAAQGGGRADVGRLLSVKRSLRPEEWGDVVATTVKRLGMPSPGAAPVAEGTDAFSINNFVTNYNRLSPQGRAILFGSKGGGGAGATGLRAQLDNLAEVADMQKNVERAANASRSAIGVRGAGTLAGLVTPHTLAPTLAYLGAVRGLGEVMTSPAFVRWYVRTMKAPASMAQARVTALNALAKTDPRIAAVAPAIATQLTAPQQQPQEAAQ